MKQSILTAVVVASIFYSCKKTITPDLQTIPAQVVIEGEVTDDPGPYTVTINQSTTFYSDNIFPPLSGAVVKIHDSQGVTDSLTESSPGVYVTHQLQGRPGGTYTLSVTWNNSAYTASSTMPAAVVFDSATIEHSAGSRRKTGQTAVVANFQDPPGVKNYYRFVETINGLPFTKDIFVLDDRLSDGKYISHTLRMDSAYLQPGDQVQVKMYCVDESIYNYFFQLDQSGGTGGFFSAASPANPTSNISGGAYGYFSAHTTRSRTVVVY